MTLPKPVALPTEREPGCPFDPPGEFAALRTEPIRPMSYPDGHVGWLVTGHQQVRAVYADPRFTARIELMHYPFPGGVVTEIPPAPPGFFTSMDPPEHTRYRRLLAGSFTVRRMALLTRRVEEIAVEYLDAMRRKGPPAELVQDYAYPVPVLTICELLGVPRADHELFQRVVRANALGTPPEEIVAAMTELQQYMGKLVADKRARPTDDLLSELTTSDLTAQELEGVATLLLASGLDTTANMIALGTFALLRHPDQLAALREDPGRVDNAVEELLRYLSVLHTSVRAAVEDVELDGHLIRAGQSVTLSINAANRDPERFAEPDRFDVGRRTLGHLAFGHGIHQCIGQQLARVEMRVTYRALLERLPGLRLTVPADEIPLRTGSIYGVGRLPVEWDRT